MTIIANELISEYTLFLSDEETKVRNRLANYEKRIEEHIKILSSSESNYNNINRDYSRYVSLYFPMMENVLFGLYNVSSTIELLKSIIVSLHEKTSDIRQRIEIDKALLSSINQNITSYNKIIDNSNKIIAQLNSLVKTEDIHPPKTGISVHFCVLSLMAMQN